MATNPPVPVPSPAPTTKLQNILALINIALQGLSLIPGLGTIIGLEQIFQKLLMTGLTAYNQEVGQPFDLTKIPVETPIP
jgi:hypothetical protein